MLREPLVHFVVLGGFVFALQWAVGPDRGASAVGPVVTPEVAQMLVAAFERRSGRAPTEAEAAELERRWRQDEALFQKGLALGLERSDPVVRRRIVAQVRLLMRARPEPDEAALRAALAADRARYRRPERTDFTQVFVRSGEPEARRSLARLRQGADPEALGDPLPGPRTRRGLSRARIAAAFGEAMASAVAVAAVGTWTGPVRSPLGWHLLRVDRRQAARPSTLDEVRARVRADLLDAERAAAERRGLSGLTGAP